MSLLITVEGLDGVGKSTLVEGLVEEMKKDATFYPWIYASKEPGSMWTGTGPDIRKLVLETPDFRPIERELLFYVDASLHSRFIRNQGNAIIVSDRGYWSHRAYLKGYLDSGHLTIDDYEACRAVLARTCTVPDCVIYLRGDLELMKTRLEGKKKDAIESLPEAFFEGVHKTYEELVSTAKFDGDRLLVLDATTPVDINIMKVVGYLKEVFRYEQLNNGDRELRQG